MLHSNRALSSHRRSPFSCSPPVALVAPAAASPSRRRESVCTPYETPESVPSCPLHPGEELLLFCTADQRPVCAHCVVFGPHQSHQCEKLQSAEPLARARLQQLTAEIESLCAYSKRVVAQCELCASELTMVLSKRMSLEMRAHDVFARVRAAVEAREAAVVAETARLIEERRAAAFGAAAAWQEFESRARAAAQSSSAALSTTSPVRFMEEAPPQLERCLALETAHDRLPRVPSSNSLDFVANVQTLAVVVCTFGRLIEVADLDTAFVLKEHILASLGEADLIAVGQAVPLLQVACDRKAERLRTFCNCIEFRVSAETLSRKSPEMVRSEIRSIGDARRVEVIPEATTGFVGMYMRIVNADLMATGWRLRARCTFVVVNKRCADSSLTFVSEEMFSRDNPGWGLNMAAWRARLLDEQGGFIENGQVTFMARVDTLDDTQIVYNGSYAAFSDPW
eukprot:m51a1_g1469 hypothetical protein (454) ;mRNA; r:243627-245295